MQSRPIKTRIVEVDQCSIFELINESIINLKERSIVAITSKVISLCEGNVAEPKSTDKDQLIENEADCFLPKKDSKYNIYLTIKNSILIPNAGVDESNTNGYYVMWPIDPQESANECWKYLREKFNLTEVGVIITDSTSAPLRWGVVGKCIAFCGFTGLNSKIGELDLFGRELRMTQVNVADALAATAVLCMGESNEQTPLCIIDDLLFVEFKQETPSITELENLRIDIEDDLYGQLLTGVQWKRRI